MKLLFIAGGLEPEAGGVGDYTWLLAREILRQTEGQTRCALVALNDPVIRERNLGNSDESMPVLRLPSSMPWPERMGHFSDLLRDFGPDWVSLQFVPYSYNNRGIVRDLRLHLPSVLKDHNVHVMFHEGWIGEYPGAPFKEKLVGIIQRREILALTEELHPQAIHTSNKLYIEQLGRRGIKPKLLPLFGNIPIVEGGADEWLYPLMQEQGWSISPASRDKFWLFGFFGTLHEPWESEPLFSHIKRAAMRTGRQSIMLSIGRIGAVGQQKWDRYTQQYAPEIGFLNLGEQPAARVSQFLNTLDYGIAATTYLLTGKSGTAAAMFDHGLPVISNRDDLAWPWKTQPPPESYAGTADIEESPTLVKMGEKFDDVLVAGLPRVAPQARLPLIAARLLNDLNGANA